MSQFKIQKTHQNDSQYNPRYNNLGSQYIEMQQIAKPQINQTSRHMQVPSKININDIPIRLEESYIYHKQN